MRLEREMLEKLVLDRALGALTPEAARLLEAYGEGDARVGELEREYEQTVGLARRALAEAREPALPPFPAERIAAEARRRRLWRITRNAGALAACVLIGLMGGMRWSTVPTPPVEAVSAVAMRGENGRGGVPDETRGSGFWSSQRIHKQAQAASAGRPAGLWRSPVQMPQAGEAS
jgi:hypothetical protein